LKLEGKLQPDWFECPVLPPNIKESEEIDWGNSSDEEPTEYSMESSDSD